MKVVVLVFLGLFACGLFVSALSPSPAARSNSSSVASSEEITNRQMYVRGMNGMTTPNAPAGNVSYLTTGEDDTVLVLTADFLKAEDCQSFYASDWARTAELVGFQRLMCKNRNSGEVWNSQLSPMSRTEAAKILAPKPTPSPVETMPALTPLVDAKIETKPSRRAAYTDEPERPTPKPVTKTICQDDPMPEGFRVKTTTAKEGCAGSNPINNALIITNAPA